MAHHPSPPIDEPDLDARIRAAERALMLRDLRVHAALGTLRERTHRLTSASHWLSGAGTFGSLLLGLLARRRADEPEHRAPPAGAFALQFLPLLWPLLPLPLRRRVNPAEAALVLRLVLPWLLRRWRRRRSGPRR